MSANANDRQVGGQHYKTSFEHWDFVITFKVPYMEAQVLKYLGRAFKKNGAQDLQKAAHFVEKLAEAYAERLVSPCHYSTGRVAMVIRRAYAKANEFDLEQRELFDRLLNWDNEADLHTLKNRLEHFAERLEAEAKKERLAHEEANEY